MSERGRLTADELAAARCEVDMAISHHDGYEQSMAQFGVRYRHTPEYLRRLYDHIAAVEAERDVAVAVVEAAREAVNACSTYRRLLANELRRLAPNEPLDIHPDASMAAGAHVGRFRRLLRDYDAATRAEEGSRGPHHHN